MLPRQLLIPSGGLRLAGSLYLPEDTGRFPGVLMCHGFTGSRIENHFMFVRQARRLAAAGLAALTFDFAGSGESEGEFSDMSVASEISDAGAALDALKGLAEVDGERLGILGYSLGGCVAACLLARRRELRCGVLWAPAAELVELMHRAVPDGVLADVTAGNLRLGREFFETLATVRPLAELPQSSAVVLVIHGSADETVPPEHGKRLAAACKRGRLALIEQAGHGFERPEQVERLFEETAGWFRRHLLPQPADRKG